MAVKSKTNWLEIRAEWEASPLQGYAWLATKYGVDKSNLKKRMDKEQWLKNTTDLPPITTKITTKTNDLQPSKRGRPTKYKPEYCQMIIDYFSDNDAYEVLEHPDDDTKRRAFLNRLKTMYKFAQKICVDVDTVANWANARDENGALANPDFFGAYKAAMTMQAAMILEGGMAGVYNPNMSALILKNNHGFRDTQTVEHDIVQTKEFESKLDAIFEKTLKKSLDAQEGLKDRFSRIIEGEFK